MVVFTEGSREFLKEDWSKNSENRKPAEIAEKE